MLTCSSFLSTFYLILKGRIAGLLPNTLSRYAYFRAHKSAVLSIFPVFGQDLIASVSADAIRLHSKGGVLRSEFT